MSCLHINCTTLKLGENESFTKNVSLPQSLNSENSFEGCWLRFRPSFVVIQSEMSGLLIKYVVRDSD